MDIPINAVVQCTDGSGGRSTYVVVNPITEQVTHLVVREKRPPHAERLVPVRYVQSSTPQEIRLRCSLDEFRRLRPFVEVEFVRLRAPRLGLERLSYYEDEDMMSLPYTNIEPPSPVSEAESQLVRHKIRAIPPGELAVRRGARVEATDGRVGWVDEFVIEPESGHITHLTMRTGHLWGDKEISIPVSEIGRIAESAVHLKLGRRQIETLPMVRVRRKF